jgi:hypothetical protein
MRFSTRLAAFGAVVLALCQVTSTRPARADATGVTLAKPRAGALPLRFERNDGQASAGTRFVARAGRQRVALTDDAAAMTLGDAVFSLRFDGAAATAAPAGEDEFAGRTNYLIGSDPSRWRRDVPSFRRVRRHDVYPGVDAVWDGANARLGLELDLTSDADLSKVALLVDGAEGVRLTTSGDLVVAAGGVEAAIRRPVLRTDGVASEGRFTLDGDGRVGVERVSARETAAPSADAVSLEYLIYIGGEPGNEGLTAVAADPAGHAYVTGYTASADFPTTPGSSDPSGPNGSDDVFVAEIDETGTDFVFATYFGGTDTEGPSSLAVDASGAVYVTGFTRSTDLPLAGNSLQTERRGAIDSFVAKLGGGGNALLYSSYLGGNTDVDFALGIAADDAGRAYVVGHSQSTNFPVTPTALTPQHPPSGGASAAFLTVLDTNAAGGASSLVYSTFFGGNGPGQAVDVAVDVAGRAYVVGEMDATDMPVTPTAYHGSIRGISDGFVLVLDPSKAGSAGLVYSTYVGGESYDDARSLALHDGLVYVAGSTSSQFLETTPDAYRTTPATTDPSDGFLLLLDPSRPDAAALRYATYFGGSGLDVAKDLAVDPAGNAWLCGFTLSIDFPTTADAIGANAPESDGYIAEISPTIAGSAGLLYSTYVGGRGGDEVNGIATDTHGNVFAGGDGMKLDIDATPTNIRQPSDDGNAFALKLRAPTTDLVLAATPLDPTPAPRGQTARVTYTITNAGPATARGVTLVYSVPAEATLASATDGAGVPLPVEAGATGDVRIATFDLAPGESASFTVAIDVSSSAGATITQSARVTSSVVEINAANNVVSATVDVRTYPKIVAVKVAAGTPFRVVVTGADFEPGAQVYIGGSASPWPNVKLKGTAKLTLKGAGLKALFPKRTPVEVRVVNPDGGAAVTTFTR